MNASEFWPVFLFAYLLAGAVRAVVIAMSLARSACRTAGLVVADVSAANDVTPGPPERLPGRIGLVP